MLVIYQLHSKSMPERVLRLVPLSQLTRTPELVIGRLLLSFPYRLLKKCVVSNTNHSIRNAVHRPILHDRRGRGRGIPELLAGLRAARLP